MPKKRSDQVIPQHNESSSRAKARGSKPAMASNSEKVMPVLKWVDGKYLLVEPSGVNTRYEDVVLLLLHYAHPKSVHVSDLKRWTGYSGITQFKNTVMQKLHGDGRAIYDSDTGEVSVTPLGRHFVYERWPVLF